MKLIYHVWRTLFAGLLWAAATVVIGTVFAAPGKADITCPSGFVPPSVNPDCYFLYMMATRNITANAGQAKMISDAHGMCSDMDNLSGPNVVVTEADRFQRQSGLPLSRAAFFVGIAATAYCPWNHR